jgi:hypothetical protein
VIDKDVHLGVHAWLIFSLLWMCAKAQFYRHKNSKLSSIE